MKRSLITVAAAVFSACTSFAEKPESLKVLMIGNSFSICVTAFMPQVAKSMGLKLDLASLYIGGCSLERHWNNVEKCEKDSAFKPYKYTRFVDGVKTENTQAGIVEVIKAEKWDVITVQQASHYSWKPETFRPYCDDLIKKCIKVHAPQAEVVIQETWSYTPWDKRFAKWNLDQHEMYRRLHATYGDYATANGLRVIPTGTAVQLWRERLPVKYTENSFGGDVCGSAKFNKEKNGKWVPKGDVFHFNSRGHYLQALVWTAKLFDADVTKCAFAPRFLKEKEATLMKEVAMAAVRGEVPGKNFGGPSSSASSAK